MNLLFAADKGYLDHVEETLRSIVRFTSEDGYDVYILHSDLDEKDQKRLESNIKNRARIHLVPVDDTKMSLFPKTDRYPIQIYYRIFAAFLLPETIDRILYLDADLIVINSLESLYHMDFNGNSILACTHIKKLMNAVNRVRLGMKEEGPYINSGVMLMNLKQLREQQDMQEVLDYVEKYKKVLALPDQDIISALYGNRIGLLDTMIYNLSDRLLMLHNAVPANEKINLDWVRKNTVIVHYCGKNKPWNKDYFGILDIFYREINEPDPYIKQEEEPVYESSNSMI